MKTITVCMGSSCFARDNRENLSAIEDYVKTRGLEGFVNIVGSLCLGACGDGPNIVIDDETFHDVKPTDIPRILDENLRKG